MSQEALELLLTGVKDQAQRKQITSAYYAFANGDPETFAVQFAVLLRAHALSLKTLPDRLQKVIATESHRMSDLILARQNSLRATGESQNIVRLGDRIELMKESQAEIQRKLATCSDCSVLNERGSIALSRRTSESSKDSRLTGLHWRSLSATRPASSACWPFNICCRFSLHVSIQCGCGHSRGNRCGQRIS
jgi:hypothetical protein